MQERQTDYMKELQQDAFAVGMQAKMYEINNFAAEFGGKIALGILKEIRRMNQERLDKELPKLNGPMLWRQLTRQYHIKKLRDEQNAEYMSLIAQQKEERRQMEKRGFNPNDFWQRHKQLIEPLRNGVSIMTHSEDMSIEDQMRYATAGLFGAFVGQSEKLHRQVADDLNSGKITQEQFRVSMADLYEIFGHPPKTVGTNFTQ